MRRVLYAVLTAAAVSVAYTFGYDLGRRVGIAQERLREND